MSKYSGKCDFCDYIAMVGIENVLASEIFVGKIKVELKELRDCIPFYPHIVKSYSTKSGIGTIILSPESWIDTKENSTLMFCSEIVQSYYNKCVENNIAFCKNNAYAIVSPLIEEPQLKEFVDRVVNFGCNATYDDIHLKAFERHRKELISEMLKYEFTKEFAENWVYHH